MTKTQPTAWSVVLRTLTGVVAGYYYAALTAVFVSFLASGERAERVIVGVLLSFLVHTLVVVAAFSFRSLAKLIVLLVFSAGGMLVVIWLGEMPVR